MPLWACGWSAFASDEMFGIFHSERRIAAIPLLHEWKIHGL
jgi:hypothetical protein